MIPEFEAILDRAQKKITDPDRLFSMIVVCNKMSIDAGQNLSLKQMLDMANMYQNIPRNERRALQHKRGIGGGNNKKNKKVKKRK